MAVSFRNQTLDDIRAKINLADFVSAPPASVLMGFRAVALEPHNEMWRGRCPFHHDVPPAIPAMIVNQKRGIFHCFTCGAGGDVFGYVMKGHGCTFPTAVKMLAQVAGVDLSAHKTGATT